MTTSGHVHWHEGLFLQPHHLQWAQRQEHERDVAERRLTWAYPYGLIEARLSTDALENMLVRFDRLRAIMPSGMEVDFPESADLPPLDIKRDFEASSQPLTIDIGVPVWYPSRGNTVEGEGGTTAAAGSAASDWRVKRVYRVAEISRPDENTGENPQPMLVRRINARLLLPGDDRTDLEVLPVCRIGRATGEDAGKPRLDASFVPACFVLAGSSRLRELVRDLVNQVEASRKELVNRLGKGWQIEMVKGRQIEQLLRLRTLNRFAGSLGSLMSLATVTPFAMYLELRELLGELAALRPDRDMFEAPAYDHNNPMVAFSDLSTRIRGLMGEDVPATFMQVGFRREDGVLIAALADEHLSRPNEYFLGIKTADDPRAVATLVENPDAFKLMSRSMVQRNIFGIKLGEERHPPLELPTQTGLHYFRLHRAESQRMWEKVKEEKHLALRWPGMESADYAVTLYMTVPG